MSHAGERSARWRYRMAAEFGHQDITAEVAELVERSGVREGMVVVSVTGSTGAVTTIEYEEGALADLRRALDQLAPPNEDYAHNTRWGDGNGFSHVRSALVKTGIAIPVVDGRLVLGTWQQIVAQFCRTCRFIYGPPSTKSSASAKSGSGAQTC